MKMGLTKEIPTDKFGRVYYGPKTWGEVVAAINDWPSDYSGAERHSELLKLHDSMHEAGYKGLAARLGREYGVEHAH